MLKKRRDKIRAISEDADGAGVPLGGVGAGSIEMGRDARFRNITINNNRTAEERIPVSEGSFLAVRAEHRGRVQTRILQPNSKLPFDDAGVRPTFCPVEQFHWRGLYPSSQYKLNDAQFPVEVSWHAMSPIIPYDHEASTLPVVFVGMYVRNPHDYPYNISAVFNWENLCGCTGTQLPESRGPIRPVVMADETGYSIQVEGEVEEEKPPVLAGLEFGFRDEIRNNAEGNYCLISKQQQDVEISAMGWNERDPRELQVFWNQFYYDGKFENQFSRSETSHSGALCNSFTLPPHKGRNIVFALSWYCPKYEISGVDQGNGYTNLFPNAIGVVEQALKFYRYYFQAVENWHGRIMGSSLPRWFNRMLINNNYVFSTNSLFTKGGDFAMVESPGDPQTVTLDRRLHPSFGTLLFFPDFEAREMALIARQEHPDAPGRLFRSAGVGCVHEPSDGATPGERLEMNANFILMAYRDYVMTGKKFLLESQFTKLQQAMIYLLGLDKDGDGLPDQEGRTTTYESWAIYGTNSYIAGLHLTALRAYIRLARTVNKDEEADRCEEIFARAFEVFDEHLWDEELGYYRAFVNGESEELSPFGSACHSSQLAGAWYADFLCLGRMIPHKHVHKALASICKINETKTGLANARMPDGSPCTNPPEVGGDPGMGVAWIAYDSVVHASSLLRGGYADRALYAIQKIYKNVHGRRSLTYNQPLAWDIESNEPIGLGDDRHVGSLSVWHLLYALQGFHLNVADSVLWLRPSLPTGVHTLSTPLFTPLTFGWMKYSEDDNKRYGQRVQLKFDSPIKLKTIVLRVPKEVEDVHVQCVSDEGPIKTNHFLAQDGPDRLVEIVPEDPLTVAVGLNITMLQSAGQRVEFATAPA